jgi:hypothetical protein
MVKGNRIEGNSSKSERLDAVISLLYEISDKLSEKKASIKEKVNRLAKLGIDNKSIASILEISEKHASKEKSLMKDKK